MIDFKCILESWKSTTDLVKSSLDQVGNLTEGMWNSCSKILEEWGIGEIEESLDTVESLTPNIEALERVRASFTTNIHN